MQNERQERIVGMFNDIAPTYDKANRILSFRTDVRWRRIGCQRTLKLLDKKELTSIVDVATGTGDLLIVWQSETAKSGINVQNFIGVDPASQMLSLARQKAPWATFYEGYATQLPIENESAQIVSISYGFRNVVDKTAALKEFARVLEPNGLLCILEFTRPEKTQVIGRIAHWYVSKALPIIGGFISGNREAYDYLPSSIGAFYSMGELENLLKENGFEPLESKSFSFGVSSLLIARKK